MSESRRDFLKMLGLVRRGPVRDCRCWSRPGGPPPPRRPTGREL